jgi:hypothetical protein
MSNSDPDPNTPSPDPAELLSIGELPTTRTITTEPNFRDKVAQKIAERVVWIFGCAVLGMLAMDFLLVGGLLLVYKCQLDQIEGVIAKGLVPLITATGTFAATLFGPLLAFVLGYYFSQKNGEQQDDSKKPRR